MARIRTLRLGIALRYDTDAVGADRGVGCRIAHGDVLMRHGYRVVSFFKEGGFVTAPFSVASQRPRIPLCRCEGNEQGTAIAGDLQSSPIIDGEVGFCRGSSLRHAERGGVGGHGVVAGCAVVV